MENIQLEETKDLKQLRKDICQSASKIGSISYHFTPRLYSVFDSSPVTTCKESINKILVSGKVQKSIKSVTENYYLTASQLNVGSSRCLLA